MFIIFSVVWILFGYEAGLQPSASSSASTCMQPSSLSTEGFLIEEPLIDGQEDAFAILERFLVEVVEEGSSLFHISSAQYLALTFFLVIKRPLRSPIWSQILTTISSRFPWFNWGFSWGLLIRFFLVCPHSGKVFNLQPIPLHLPPCSPFLQAQRNFSLKSPS